MLKDTIIKRRTIRRFTDKKMPLGTLKELLVYASMAPSNISAHPAEFTVVGGKEGMDRLVAIDRFDAKHLADAPPAVLTVANKDVYKYRAQEAAMTIAYLDLLVQEEDYRSDYLPFHGNTTDKDADAEAYARDYFNTPDDYSALGILTIGKKDERARTRKEFPTDGKTHEDRF